MAYLEFEHVSKAFGKETVLEDVSFTVEENEICGFIGRNGSGKTVIFKLLAGLLLPDSGRIVYQGEDLTKRRTFIESMGTLIETPGFIPHYSGLRNLKILNGLSSNPVPPSEVKRAMEKVGLDWKSRKPVKAYSLGMKQKLGIAQAVMNRPRLLILDEPMNSLDLESVREMREYFLELQKEQGLTILIASHIREDINALCGRIYRVGDKRVVPELSPDSQERSDLTGMGAEQ